MGQVVGIYSDTVTAHQTRGKLHKIPFGACGFENGLCVNTHPVKHNRQLIHKGDVNIPLTVLNNLSRLSYPDALCPVHTGLYYHAVNLRHCIQSFSVHAGYNLDNIL